MTQPDAGADAPIVIDADLPCAICGYNLKGLSSDGRCPECGQAVARTYTPELSRSDPAWLRGQANAMLWLGGLCLANYTPSSPSPGMSMARDALFIVTSLATAWGAWRLATPEPPGPPDSGLASAQRFLRFAACSYALVTTCAVIAYLGEMHIWRYTGVIAAFGLLATDVLVGWFLLRIARRAADRSLIRHAKIVLYTLPLGVAWSLLLFLAPGEWFSRVGSGRFIAELFGFAGYLFAAAVIVAGLLFGRVYETLRATARAAELSAAAAPAPAISSAST